MLPLGPLQAAHADSLWFWQRNKNRRMLLSGGSSGSASEIGHSRAAWFGAFIKVYKVQEACVVNHPRYGHVVNSTGFGVQSLLFGINQLKYTSGSIC